MNDYYSKYIEHSKIATQLKSFRSVVRLKEIKKSLQEQRFVFIYCFYFIYLVSNFNYAFLDSGS
jgi:hypothetical protein